MIKATRDIRIDNVDNVRNYKIIFFSFRSLVSPLINILAITRESNTK